MTTRLATDYLSARARFRAAALRHRARTEALAIDATGTRGETLTIDMASLGPDDATRVVVVSSGTHGVEGHFGSAVQSALLERDDLPLPADTRLVLIHAVNPFGMAWDRRVNEDNVDQNRNFLCEGEAYRGAPEGYAELNGLLNPPRPPRRLSLFLPRAALAIATQGLAALKQAVAAGQYDFPQGLFFGGAGPTCSHRLLSEALPRWVGDAATVHHVDFHTGLGKRSTYKLFVDHGWGTEALEVLGQTYGTDVVEPWEPEGGISYTIRGGLGTWCKALFPDRTYEVLAAEFGTEPVLTVIEGLHRENRAWHHADRDARVGVATRARLRQIFCPDDPAWQRRCVRQGLAIVDTALSGRRKATSPRTA